MTGCVFLRMKYRGVGKPTPYVPSSVICFANATFPQGKAFFCASRDGAMCSIAPYGSQCRYY